jgi:hypothetical protein
LVVLFPLFFLFKNFWLLFPLSPSSPVIGDAHSSLASQKVVDATVAPQRAKHTCRNDKGFAKERAQLEAQRDLLDNGLLNGIHAVPVCSEPRSPARRCTEKVRPRRP